MTAYYLSYFVGLGAGYLMGRVSSMMKKRGLYRKAFPREKRVSKHLAWDELPSGAAIDIAPGLVGYAAKIDGNCWWWIARQGRSIVEGPAADMDGARLAVMQTAQEFLFPKLSPAPLESVRHG